MIRKLLNVNLKKKVCVINRETVNLVQFKILELFSIYNYD